MLAIDHKYYVAGYIQDQINRLDATLKTEQDHKKTERIGGGHFGIGAAQRSSAIATLMAAHDGDAAFRNFHTRLGTFLTRSYKENQIPLPNNQAIKFTPTSEVNPWLTFILVLPMLMRLP